MTQSLSRRHLLALGAGASAPFVLSGCLSGNPTAAKTTQTGDKFSGEVEWWTINLQKNYADYINSMIAGYTKQHPKVKINWVDVPGQDITTKLLAAIASGKVPDAVNYTSTTLGLFASSMTDLSQLFSADELGRYAAGLADPLKAADGRRVAIPWYNGGTSLGFYNTDLLKKVSFDEADPPTTIDQAVTLAERYHTATKKSAMNLIPSVTLLQSYGIEMLSADKRTAAFNTAEAAAILEKFKPLYGSGAIAPGAISTDIRNLPQTLDNKRVAFSPMEISTNLLNIQKNAPDVYRAIAVAPPVTGTADRFILPGQQVFGIPKASGNQAAAAEWLKFVTSPENQLAFCKLVAIYPSTSATLQDPFFTEISGTDPASEARKTLVQTFPHAVDGSLGSGNDEQLGLLFAAEVQAYLPGKKTAQQALAAAEKSWNTELSKEK
ncbi:ABC transporter substrate-binding protein [Microlunatus soli]|uniref:Carbohydrate ABC transporter substrate-binding protein, CUT1 family n=1 Tax=Microlunatus soli TaxID=630515 RepID=A0A1H1R7F8_9ACTN|nr:extracellular solute-binding protein [Microlunatus soli]SDS31702.1 carbohydrate ABC transporter substrate-binding protein, CUT1 family [Microlunatus soli]